MKLLQHDTSSSPANDSYIPCDPRSCFIAKQVLETNPLSQENWHLATCLPLTLTLGVGCLVQLRLSSYKDTLKLVERKWRHD